MVKLVLYIKIFLLIITNGVVKLDDIQ